MKKTKSKKTHSKKEAKKGKSSKKTNRKTTIIVAALVGIILLVLITSTFIKTPVVGEPISNQPIVPSGKASAETDGGRDPAVFGTCTDAQGTYSDKCFDANVVIEKYYASNYGKCIDIRFNCVIAGYSGCKDGYCYKK